MLVKQAGPGGDSRAVVVAGVKGAVKRIARTSPASGDTLQGVP